MLRALYGRVCLRDLPIRVDWSWSWILWLSFLQAMAKSSDPSALTYLRCGGL